jgi:hypothetical protein
MMPTMHYAEENHKVLLLSKKLMIVDLKKNMLKLLIYMGRTNLLSRKL